MKKIMTILAVAVMAICASSIFTSCSKDDDNEKKESYIDYTFAVSDDAISVYKTLEIVVNYDNMDHEYPFSETYSKTNFSGKACKFSVPSSKTYTVKVKYERKDNYADILKDMTSFNGRIYIVTSSKSSSDGVVSTNSEGMTESVLTMLETFMENNFVK